MVNPHIVNNLPLVDTILIYTNLAICTLTSMWVIPCQITQETIPLSTQPLVAMSIQITHKQEIGMHILWLHALQPLLFVNSQNLII